MNKFLTLIAAVAMSLTLSAAESNFFNRAQFQGIDSAEAGTYALTVPLVYKGSLSLEGWFVGDADITRSNERCIVSEVESDLPLYMTICQPCIDCLPCTMLALKATTDGAPAQFENVDEAAEDGEFVKDLRNPITVWNLYTVFKEKWAGKEYVSIQKIDLLDTEIFQANFFTGTSKGKAAAGARSVSYNFLMTGKKNDFKFKFLPATFAYGPDSVTHEDRAIWTVAEGAKKDTAYIKSVKSFEGTFSVADFTTGEAGVGKDEDGNEVSWNDYAEAFQMVGNVKLSRNSSLSKDFVEEAFTATLIKAAEGKGWENCDQDEILPAAYCEAIFAPGATYDLFDLYLIADEYEKYYDAENEANDRLSFDCVDKEFLGTSYENIYWSMIYSLQD